MDLIFTTSNEYKIKAAQLVLEKYNIHVIGENIEVDEIQSRDPKEVILDKVKKSYNIIKKPLISMDSGLFIESLNEFPGVYTRSILETIGEEGLMKLTKDIEKPKAYVQRMIAFTDGKITKIFSSRGYGEIIQEKRGDNGWNYDKIFYVKEKDKTLAEMTDEEKVTVWGDAWDQLGKWLKKKDN